MKRNPIETCRVMLAHCRSSRRGAVLPLVSALMIVLIFAVGFGIDLAFIQLARTELRAGIDAAARAGAETLSRTDSLGQAKKEVRRVARQNRVAGSALIVKNKDITFGRSEQQANGTWNFDTQGSPYNAVQIAGGFGDKSSNPRLPLFFGPVFGVDTVAFSETATSAVRMVDICLVLDRSSSMKLDVDSATTGMSIYDWRFLNPPVATSRWAALDRSVDVFVDVLNSTSESEKVGLVTFGSDLSMFGYHWRESTVDQTLTEDVSSISDRVDDLSNSIWNGNTFIESGMRDGLRVLTQLNGHRNHSEKVLIVLTDGYQTNGSALAAARDIAGESVIIHSITFGEHADRDLMREVAATGGGKHYHADNEAQLQEAFRELAARTAVLIE